MPGYWSFLAMLLPTGLAVLLYTTAANSATQLGTTPQMRGRVMGVYLLVFLGGAPVGSPLVGWTAEQFGPRMSLLAGGVISAVAAVAVGVMLARFTGTRVRDGVRPLAQLRPPGLGQRPLAQLHSLAQVRSLTQLRSLPQVRSLARPRPVAEVEERPGRPG